MGKDVLIIRSCRLILDAWREERRRISLARYAHVILTLNMSGKLFLSWRSLLLGIYFRRMVILREDRRKFCKTCLSVWYSHAVNFRAIYRTVHIFVSENRVKLSLNRWISETREELSLKGKSRALSLIRESRILQTWISTLKCIFRDRRKGRPQITLSRICGRSLQLSKYSVENPRGSLRQTRSASLSGLRRKMYCFPFNSVVTVQRQ